MRPIFLFIFLLIFLIVSAQKTGRPLVDSLLIETAGTTNDTLKARLYNRIFNELTNINIDEAMQYARAGLAHAKKMQWPKGIAVFQNNLGSAYSDKGNYDSAMYFFLLSLKLQKSVNDKVNMASTYNNMAVAASNIKADFVTASQYYFEALAIAEEMKDSANQANTLNNLARIFHGQGNFLKALEFENRAFAIIKKTGTADDIATSLKTIGNTYYSMGRIKEAQAYFQNSLALFEGTGNTAGLASIWSSIPLVYGNNYPRIIEARQKAKGLWNEVNPLHFDAIVNMGNLGVAYLDMVRYDTNHIYANANDFNKNRLLKEAQLHLESAIKLAGQIGDIANKNYFTGVLAEAQEQMGDFKNAYYNFRQYKEVEDSIFSQENKNKIAAAESKREIDKKNNELKIKELKLSNQRKTSWGLICGLVLLAIIGLLFYRQSQLRKKTNTTLVKLNTELDNANKVKAKFFAILSHDLRAPVAKLINFLHLQKNEPGLLSTEQAGLHQKKITASAETLLENMEAMLLWSKSQMEDFKPVKNKIYTSDLFKQLYKSFTLTEGVEITYPQNENLSINTDKNYLLTIMHNLTSNAIVALKNKADALIKWDVQKNKDFITFSIDDNGPGLPAEIQTLLNNKETHLGTKNGFGFQIIKDMAKAIDCNITFNSSNTGTVFYLNIVSG